MTTFKWNEENTAQAEALAKTITAYGDLEGVAKEIGTSVRSLASKLRSLGYDVPKKTTTPTFSDEQSEALTAFVEANAGNYTYGEIADNFAGGAFTAKQIQGKLLALELTGNVKPTVHEKAPSKYTAEQENTIISMANGGQSIEAIAEAVGAEVKSIRGKALSLLKAGSIQAIPHSTTPTKASTKADAFDGIDVAASTIAELVEATGKTERGIKAMITRRGISCKDYTPKAKKEVAVQEAA